MLMFRKISSTLLLSALFGLLLPVAARAATTVPITAGTIDFNRQGPNGPIGDASFNLDDITVNGTIYNFAIAPDCNHFGQVCTRGTGIHLPTLHVTEDGFNVGSVTINGETINQVYYLGAFHFDSPAITVPRMSAISGFVAVTAPFTVSGDLLGCRVPVPSSTCSDADTIFSRSFVGSGVVTYRLRAIKGLDLLQSNALYSYDLAEVTLRFNNPS